MPLIAFVIISFSENMIFGALYPPNTFDSLNTKHIFINRAFHYFIFRMDTDRQEKSLRIAGSLPQPAFHIACVVVC